MSGMDSDVSVFEKRLSIKMQYTISGPCDMLIVHMLSHCCLIEEGRSQ